MNRERFLDDVEYGHARVQRPERILKDELNLAPKRFEPLCLERQHVNSLAAVVEGDRARIRRHRAQQDFAQGGLAAAALANQPQTFAALDLSN